MKLDEYVGGLKLQGDRPVRSTHLRAFHNLQTPPSAVVDVGAVLAFQQQVSSQERRDVIDSVQLAQRAASGLFDRITQIENWYGKFIEVLERIGWYPKAFGFIRHEQRSGDLEVDARALSIVEAIATGGSLTILKQAVSTLKGAASRDSRLQIFSRHAATGSSGNFQIGDVYKKDEILAMAMGAFHYRAGDSTTGFILGRWAAKEIDFWSSAQCMEFDTARYATVRDTVKARLGDPSNYVADLGPLS